MPYEGDEDYDRETLRDILYRIEKSLLKLPKKDIDSFLRDRILSFIKSI